MTNLRTHSLPSLTFEPPREVKSNFKLLIPTFKTLEFVDVNQIISISASESYSKIHLVDGVSYLSTQSFGKLVEMLLQHNFFQCHKSHLLNLDKICRYHKDGQAEMTDGSKIPVARRRKEEFVDILLYALP